jgi:Zn finger protein HypA/HybF involved in hydrogenase expression
MVAGGINVNMWAVTNTYICNNCTELVDVAVGEYGQVVAIGTTIEGLELYSCPNCDSRNELVKWQFRKRPCPKCKKGRMSVSGPTMMTD